MKNGWLLILATLGIMGCDLDAKRQGVPADPFPVLNPDDPESIAQWEASRLNFADARISVVKSRFFHGTLGDANPKAEKSIAIQVYHAKTKGITPEQQAAIDHFVEHEATIHAAVRDAICEHYKKSYPAYKEGLSLGGALFGGAGEIEEILPEITSGEELDDRVQFGSIYIHPPYNGAVHIGMDFLIPWDEEHGIGLRLKEGKVIAIGTGHEAFPAPSK